MGEDEVMVLTLSALVGGVALLRWMLVAATHGPRWRSAPAAWRGLVAALPLLSLALVHVGLGQVADVYVQGDPRYRAQYDAMGLQWLMVGLWLFGLLGVPVARELAVRSNRAAAIVGAGATLGLTATYLGGNVGDGPGWWVVVVSSGAATAAWLLGWAVVAQLAHAADRVTIDQHEPTAWRTAGLLTGIGLVLGRAVAGDWVSGWSTAVDVVQYGWFAAVMVATEVHLVNWLAPPHAPDELDPMVGGVLPGALWVLLAVVWVALWPHPNPVSG
jgi:hypothetical protein